MKKKHKLLRILLLSAAALILCVVAAGYLVFQPQIKAASSVQKLEEGLYSLTYEGDYGFDAFLAQGGAPSDAEMADYITSFLTHGLYKQGAAAPDAATFGCSTLTARAPNGGVLFGRNYDWADCDVMVVRTKPQNGYSSLSVTCLDFLGLDKGWKPEGVANQMIALASVYLPLDGMNEMGLCVADLMAGDSMVTHQQTDKPDVTTVSAIRLLLDHAATVDEAIELLNQYDMNSSIGSAHHFAVCDASGKSVVIEYINGELQVAQTPVVTNHYLTEGRRFGIGSWQSHLRFDALTERLQSADGLMDAAAVRDSMAAVAQCNYPTSRGDESTQWTLICDTGARTAELYRHERYEKAYPFTLP